MRGRDEAHVDRMRAAHHLLFQRVQQLRLQRARKLGDVLEEERAAVGLLQEPLSARRSEELVLEPLARQRAAIDGHERAVGPRARVVQRERDAFPARARLPADQHMGVRGRGFAHELHHPPHGCALADERPGAVGGAQAALEHGVLALHAPLVERAVHRVQELVVEKGLDEIVDRTRAQRADRALER